MENNDFTRCRYCRVFFRPERRNIPGDKHHEYIECPRCGNGYIQKRRNSRRNGGVIYVHEAADCHPSL